MIKETYKYSELTSKIIGCAMTVHKTLGNGFQEVIYQRALAIEMNLSRIEFSREFEMPIFLSRRADWHKAS
jgi:GxxExxY protein